MRNRDLWDRQSTLPGLRAVIDPNDLGGHKNAYLDCLHKVALRRRGGFAASDRALDFGCGFGRIAAWLAPRVASVCAVDGHLSMLRRARPELIAAGLGGILLSPYDGSRLPFRSGAFDKVTAVWVLQHITDDQELAAVLGELARVTRPGGRLLFVERVADDPVEPWNSPEVIIRRRAESYLHLLATAGLPCGVAEAICDDGPVWHRSRVNRLVFGGRVPRWLFPLIARIDLAIRRRRTMGDWTDHLFVCTRA